MPSSLASPDGTASHGATWPDVALAIIAFARADTWNFVLALASIGVILAFLWLLYWVAPRKLQKDYALRRMERKEKEAQERSSPEGDDDD